MLWQCATCDRDKGGVEVVTNGRFRTDRSSSNGTWLPDDQRYANPPFIQCALLSAQRFEIADIIIGP